jgi:hypothetical protein
MPYITQEERDQIDPKLQDLLMHMGPLTPGQFVYIIYQIAQWQATEGGVRKLPVNWTKCNEIMGNITCAGSEFYRRVVGPYEDTAIEKNGDCTPPRTRFNQASLPFEPSVDPYDAPMKMEEDD